MMLANVMIAISFILIFFTGQDLLKECAELGGAECSGGPVAGYLRVDAQALMNFGHAGLLLIFTGMYWKGGKIYCFYMVKLSFLLIAAAALGSLVIAVATPSMSRIERSLLSLSVLTPAAAGLASVSFGIEGFRAQPSLSLLQGRSGYVERYESLSQTYKSGDFTPEAVRAADRLHTVLIVGLGLLLAEVAVGVGVVFASTDGSEYSRASLGGHVQALVRGYTMMFHHTFVLSTGFGAAVRIDDNCDMFLHGGFVFFIFDCFTFLFTTAGCMTSHGETARSATFSQCMAERARLLPLRLIAQAAALWLAWRLRPYTLAARDRNKYADHAPRYRPPRLTLFNMVTRSYTRDPPSALGLLPAEARPAAPTVDAKRDLLRSDGGSPGTDGDSSRGVAIEMQSTNVVDAADTKHGDSDDDDTEEDAAGDGKAQPRTIVPMSAASILERKARMRAGGRGSDRRRRRRRQSQTRPLTGRQITCKLWACSLAVVAFATVWAFQGLYIIGLEPEEKGLENTASLLVPRAPAPLMHAYSAAENFGLHGAAFFAFHVSLSYQSAVAFSLFRSLHAATGLLLGGLSVAQMASCVGAGAGLLGFLAARAVAGGTLLLGFALFTRRVHEPHIAALDALMGRKAEALKRSALKPSLGEDRGELVPNGVEQDGGELELGDEGKCVSVGSGDVPARNAAQADAGRELLVAIREHQAHMRSWTVAICAAFLISAGLELLAATRSATGQDDEPQTLLMHAPGYDTAFHVSYLLVLFLWHGVSTGNLVAIDVARAMCASLALTSAVQIVTLPRLHYVSRAWAIALYAKFALTLTVSTCVLRGCNRAASLMAFCSSDPLRTWTRSLVKS